MNKIIFCLSLILLVSCKHDSGDNSTPTADDELPSYPFNFDQETPGGIQIESNGHSIPQLYDIDTWYDEVSQCVADGYGALSLTGYEFVLGPPVVIKEELSGLCDASGGGVYCVNYTVPFMALDSSNSSVLFRREWKHEFIHHILYSNDIDTNHAWHIQHIPSEIWDCEWQ